MFKTNTDNFERTGTLLLHWLSKSANKKEFDKLSKFDLQQNLWKWKSDLDVKESMLKIHKKMIAQSL